MSTRDDPETGGLLTIGELAERLRVTERTVSRWIAAGNVAVVRVGGAVRIPREVLTPTWRKHPDGRPH